MGYKFLAQVVWLQKRCKLNQYTLLTTNDLDWVLLTNSFCKYDINHRWNPCADMLDWCNDVVLAFNSMMRNERFVINFHTNEIIRISKNAFSSKVIHKETIDQKQKRRELQWNSLFCKVLLSLHAKTFLTGYCHQFIVVRYGLCGFWLASPEHLWSNFLFQLVGAS